MVGNPGPHDDNAILKDFKSWGPPSYDGTLEPARAKKWRKDIEKIFDLLRCTDVLKVRMATYMLVDDAWDWWKSTSEGIGPITWDEFQNFFLDSFNEVIRKVQMLERGCEVLQRRQEMATQKRGANQFQQQNQFGGDKRQRVQGKSSQGQRQQPQQQRVAPQDRAPQQPNRPQGNQGQQQPRPQQQQQRDDGRVQC
ncbi:hypothetical protein BVC80_8373g8 [Macleaya cordata]|uniref:Retrotransposon gag domain-containing protein n=1 Tax=Macleaya cordata TaxID=56857 RepID=A0A200R860_MACCD|nr:hypothetical protein BVC80_8373g8 [Macleaya cordata]